MKRKLVEKMKVRLRKKETGQTHLENKQTGKMDQTLSSDPILPIL